MGNHLKGQTSPYLLQHADQPVDWYPWGDTAFEKAARENKPVFLSIGYSTCHWCHVMAKESFESKEIAELLNRDFVSVKVDREERPDIDSVYMSVCQALTGSGGWPMSVFLTPNREPFFAGTYFPPETGYGMTGFADILRAIAGRWNTQGGKKELTEAARHLVEQVGRERTAGKRTAPPEERLAERAVEIFAAGFDRKYGGFGSAPKFPTPHNLLFLILYAEIRGEPSVFRLAEKTLEQMRRGGIFDHIGFGFSRYSTDRYYLVPHFEKMLYDNALLIMAYGAAYQSSGNGMFLDTAKKTAAYVLREMTGGEGEFYSAQDADSEGEEGKFYVWDYREIIQVLGPKRGRLFCRSHIRSAKGFLDEYAYYGAALLLLYEASGKNVYLERAGQICGEAFRQFTDERNGGYFLCGLENETLVMKPKETYDGALPSGNSVMAYCLVRLFQITGDGEYDRLAKRQLAFLSGEAEDYPAGHGMFLLSLLLYLHPMPEITVVMAKEDEKTEKDSTASIMRALPLYAKVRILTEETEGYSLLNGKTTYYVCKNHVCLPPSNEVPRNS